MELLWRGEGGKREGEGGGREREKEEGEPEILKPNNKKLKQTGEFFVMF